MEHEKNEPRRRPPERNSRAAQAAQQRRDQRREQAHLEELRQKQRKRARHRTRRRINPGVWKRILIMAAVVAAVVLSMVLFFRVRSVEVTGSAYYTADEIRAACGVAQGDNLLTLSRARIAGNIMAELPYVSTVQVTRRLPDTLELTVTEYDVTYAAQGADGASYLITADGKITEKIDETAARGHIAVEISYLKPEEQQMLLTAIDSEQATPSLSQAQRMKKLSRDGKLNDDTMLDIMMEQKKPEGYNVVLSADKLRKYFPRSYTPQKMEETILKLLDAWLRKRQRDQSR